jgi:peptide/nickel transport system substrate-binding protein
MSLPVHKPLRYLAVCSMMLLVAASPGCGSGSQTGERADAATWNTDTTATGRHGGRLVIGVQQEPERLSEILNATATTNLVCNLIFSKFVKYDDQLNLLPDLIDAIPTLDNGGVSPDHLIYTYGLREDAAWHDGEPVTSADVRFTYEIIMNPDVAVESREGWDVIESIETPDPRTVVFHLKRPYPDFVSETFLDEAILPRHLLAGVKPAEFHLAGYHRAPIGSGPFVFKEWVPGSHIALTRNPNHYGEGPSLDEIFVKFVPDENSLLVQLKTGEIDLYDNANLTFLEEARRVPNIVVYATPTMMYEHLDLNTENPILQDRRVRRALAYATDREEIATQVYRGVMQVAPLDEHPSSKYFNPAAASAMRHDPLEARRLLRDAGWIDRNGDGILEKDGRDLTLTITATAGNPDRENAELVLQRQYRDVGIDLRIKNYNATALYGSYEDGGILKRGKFDIAMYAWLSSPEPATKTTLYGIDNIPPHGQNHPRIRHAQLSELLDRGASEVDVETRVKLYHRVADILVQEMPVIPLFWYTTIDLCDATLRNYKPNPTQSSDTWNANTWYLSRGTPELSAVP